jgi:uncharacterized protein
VASDTADTTRQAGIGVGGPTPAAERSFAVDVLRGFALLGILTMNVLTFGLHDAAYMNPLYKGPFAEGWSGRLDLAAYWLQALLCDQRFMSIFAMLFGAAIVITTGRAQSPARVHYRRSLFLIVLGAVHAYGLWYGDILLAYGLCALWLYFARAWRPGLLLGIAGVVFVVPMFILGAMGGVMWVWYDSSIAEVAALVQSGATLTSQQQETWSGWKLALAVWQPSSAQLIESVQTARGPLAGVWARNAALAAMMQFFMLPMWGVWRVTSLMMAGMALWKLGVLQGTARPGVYRWMITVGYGVGLPLAVLATLDSVRSGFFMPRFLVVGMNVQYVASLLVALGHIGVVMLVVRGLGASSLGASGAVWMLRKGLGLLANVGRMSLSNYLLQTVLMVGVFTGLGLFERLARWQLLALVPIVWCVQLALSAWWLGKHKQGPMESVLRGFVYAGEPTAREPTAREPTA